MKQQRILEILNEEFDVPIDAPMDTDLTDFIQDSIDLGEILAIILDETTVSIPILEFHNKRTLAEFLEVVSKYLDVE